jgi:4-hydroxybenzoate polyprenyltransferase
MSFLVTAWKMLRFRSVLILVLFMLLSIALHTNGKLLPAYIELLGVIILAASYMTATCINDLVDWKIDQINLKGNTERPLINGTGSRKQLIVLAIIGAVLSIGLGFVFSGTLGVVMIISIVLNTLYSLPPLRVSYRAWLTPFYLSFCYVVVSYIVGYVLVTHQQAAGQFDWNYVAVFYFFFVARISLKDFRDRVGDAIVGKPTLILKHGKATVSVLSSSAALAAIVGIIILSWRQPVLAVSLALFGICIGIVEYRIYHAQKLNDELLSIAYGARMGNGLLLTFLGWLLLKGQSAPFDVVIVFILTMLAVYGYVFWFYIKHADQFFVGGHQLKMK